MVLAVTTHDLALYLDEDEVDEDRALLLLGLAQGLCEQVVSPLPDGAKAVILSSTARAYSNPTQVIQDGAGPFQQTLPSGGVYLTRNERAALRRASGTGGAFSVDLIADYQSRFDGD